MSPFGGGGLGPHLTQCGQGRDVPVCQVSSFIIQPFGHNTPTTTLQTGQTDRTDRQTDRQTGQRFDSIRRTVLQTVVKKRCVNHIRSKFVLCKLPFAAIVRHPHLLLLLTRLIHRGPAYNNRFRPRVAKRYAPRPPTRRPQRIIGIPRGFI